jgi:hypothetical protein
MGDRRTPWRRNQAGLGEEYIDLQNEKAGHFQEGEVRNLGILRNIKASTLFHAVLVWPERSRSWSLTISAAGRITVRSRRQTSRVTWRVTARKWRFDASRLAEEAGLAVLMSPISVGGPKREDLL